MDRNTIKKIVDERTIDESAKPILERAIEEGIETAWDGARETTAPVRVWPVRSLL